MSLGCPGKSLSAAGMAWPWPGMFVCVRCHWNVPGMSRDVPKPSTARPDWGCPWNVPGMSWNVPGMSLRCPRNVPGCPWNVLGCPGMSPSLALPALPLHRQYLVFSHSLKAGAPFPRRGSLTAPSLFWGCSRTFSRILQENPAGSSKLSPAGPSTDARLNSGFWNPPPLAAASKLGMNS